MHMRTKKWARPELKACPYYTDTPEEYRGKWSTLFPMQRPIHIELGCGKGVSSAQMVSENRDINYILIDIADNVLGDCRRNIASAFNGLEPDNVMIVKYDIEYISRIFSEDDRIQRIYIHFCNPWTKRPKYEKRRLTHPRQLQQYREFLCDDSEIRFKTDDEILFNDSLIYFRVCGFENIYLTEDLHHDGFAPNYQSEHEMRFSAMGIPIKFGIFRKKSGDYSFDATRWIKQTAQTMPASTD